MTKLILELLYSNAAKGISQIAIAGGLLAIARFLVIDDWVKASIYGAALGLFGAAMGNLGVVGARAVTTTPPNAPDSKGDKEIKP